MLALFVVGFLTLVLAFRRPPHEVMKRIRARWRRLFQRGPPEARRSLLNADDARESYVLPHSVRKRMMDEDAFSRTEVPPRILEILSGVMLGVLVFAFCNVYASAVFMQHIYLHPHLQAGVGMNVLAAAVLCAVSVRYSKVGVYVASPDINPTIIHVGMAAHLVRSIPKENLQVELLPTMIASIALSTLLVSFVTYVLGAFGWTRLVQFTPTTVVRGFLACVGVEIIKTAVENATGSVFHEGFSHNIPLVFRLDFWLWLVPALAVGVPLYTLKRYNIIRSVFLFPAFLIIPIVAFYSILFVTGTTLQEARHTGWLYPEARSGGCLDHWLAFDYQNVNYSALLGTSSYMVIMIVIVAIDFLLKLAGTEDTLKIDVDFDHEFRVTGMANSVLGFFLLPPGYGSLKFLLLNHSVVGNVNSRLPAAIASVFNFCLFLAGFPLINYLPRFFLAGLFIYAALAFVVENLVDSYQFLTKKEYAVVWLLVILHFFMPLVLEIGVGLLLASGVFVIQYATRCPIKIYMSGADYRAVTRTLRDTQKLAQLGNKMLTIVRLQGYIFFGTASQVLQALEPLFHHKSSGRSELVHHLVLDFEEVTGVDTSSHAVFNKLSRQAKRHNLVILWTGLNYRRYQRLKQAQVLTSAVTFPDLDSAVEWCEDQLLSFSSEARSRWLLTDALCYIHAVHYVQYMALSTFHGLVAPSFVRRFVNYCEPRTLEAKDYLFRAGAGLLSSHIHHAHTPHSARARTYTHTRAHRRTYKHVTHTTCVCVCVWVGGCVGVAV